MLVNSGLTPLTELTQLDGPTRPKQARPSKPVTQAGWPVLARFQTGIQKTSPTHLYKLVGWAAQRARPELTTLMKKQSMQ